MAGALPPYDDCARLSAEHVFLRHMGPQDTPFFFELEINSDFSPLYRFRGATPGADVLTQVAWRDVLVQMVICRRDTRQPIGIVALFGVDFRNSFGSIRGALIPTEFRSRMAIEGFDLFIDYCFRIFPLRKLYGQVIEFNSRGFSSVFGNAVKVEGRLTAHEYHDGRYWDQLIVALSREDYYLERSRKSASPLLAALREARESQ